MASPIRIGFIGLISNANAQLAGTWARKAHLPYLTQSQHYTITALCNSSLDSAKKAVQVYGLDANAVKVYDNPEALANDTDVDMVVCSVNVEKHYQLIKPALLAGKKVFCEWPLASNLAQMKELVEITEQSGSKTIIGLQGRVGAYVNAIHRYIGEGEGKLGPVLSTSMVAYGLILGMASPEEVAYLMDLKSGGNVFTISGIHLLDTITATLGDITNSNTLLKNQRPTIALLDSSFNICNPAHPNNTPEHVFMHGSLGNTSTPFSFTLRGGQPFKDTPTFDWRIYCQKGEIRITGTEQLWLGGGLKFQVHDFLNQSVEDVDLYGEGHMKELGIKDDIAVKYGLEAPADNVGRLYEAFAQGRTEAYLDFKGCLKWAEFIQEQYDANGF